MIHDTLTDLVCTEQATQLFFSQHPDHYTVYRQLLDFSSKVSEWWKSILVTTPQEDQAALHHLCCDLEQISVHPCQDTDTEFVFHLNTGRNGESDWEEIDPNTEEGYKSLRLLLFFVRHNDAFPGIYYWCYSEGRQTSLPEPYNTTEDIQTIQLQREQHLGGILDNGLRSLGITAAITAQAKQYKQLHRPCAIITKIPTDSPHYFDTYAFVGDTWVPCAVTQGYDLISKAPITTLRVQKNV